MTALGAWLTTADRSGIHAGIDVATSGVERAMSQATALCAASTEPFAASLAWTALVLTQRDDLQHALRAEQGADAADLRHSLLARVVVETQRLLPSSAMVTRMTARPVRLGGCQLPASCEVVVSSLLAHRDPQLFPQPRRFDPQRWCDLQVSPFEFFPFGAGARACLGATLARAILVRTVRRLVERGALRLVFDTQVGWRLPDALTPSPGIAITVDDDERRRPGRALGPITALVDVDAA